jgi:hypothetical protein
VATDVRKWLARFDAAAAIDRSTRAGHPPDIAWSLGVSLPLIDAARAALANAPALSARRASEDAAVREIWARLRARLCK